MIITKSIVLKDTNIITMNDITEFWKSRGFKIIETSESHLYAKRGRFIGNLLSYNMANILTKLTINYENNNEISCEFKINTVMQYITKWNKDYWQLELKTFESTITQGDQLESEWLSYSEFTKKENRIMNIKMISLGIGIALLGLLLKCFLV